MRAHRGHRLFRDRLGIPISEEDLAETPFYRPPADSEEIEYLLERRHALGGFVPQRRVLAVPIASPPPLASWRNSSERMRPSAASHASASVGRGWAYGVQGALSSVGGMLGPMVVVAVLMMGGSYRSPGNTAPTTEWNVSVDPEAAKLCIAAFGRPEVAEARRAVGLPPLPLALGLDVTERAKLLPGHLSALAARAGAIGAGAGAGADAPAPIPTKPVLRFIDDALRFYMEFHSRYDGFYGAFVHDPFAVAAALDPSLVRTEALTVDVELGGTLTTGETVTDWRRTWGRPPTLDVAVEGDAEAFFERFIERVGGLAARVG
jgi:purine nucleosidase